MVDLDKIAFVNSTPLGVRMYFLGELAELCSCSEKFIRKLKERFPEWVLGKLEHGRWVFNGLDVIKVRTLIMLNGRLKVEFLDAAIIGEYVARRAIELSKLRPGEYRKNLMHLVPTAEGDDWRAFNVMEGDSLPEGKGTEGLKKPHLTIPADLIIVEAVNDLRRKNEERAGLAEAAMASAKRMAKNIRG